jgi:hypothetical protein
MSRIGNIDPITDLAYKFAINYFNISFGKQYRTYDYRNIGIYESVFKDQELIDSVLRSAEDTWYRNIVVIGAGATYDTYPEIPLAVEAYQKLECDFGKIYNPNINSRYILERDRLRLLYNSPFHTENEGGLDFELTLSLLAQFGDPDYVRGKIKDMYSYRYCVSMTYEIIAHLFRHRFVDAIINFNFDEILDQAIEDEMNGAHYYSIISDGHVMDLDDIVIGNRLRVPLYIKPHGTASHKSTLKFTKDDYFYLPVDMQKLIADLVGGKIGAGETPIPVVNLIVVGFGMGSIEFLDVIRNIDSRVTKLNVFYINNKNNDDLHKLLTHNKHDMYWIDSSRFSPIDPNYTPLGSLFNEIWRRVIEVFCDDYTPRLLHRHNLLYKLFYSSEFLNKSNGSKKIEYFRLFHTFFESKILVEISISILRNKGFFYMKGAKSNRIGKLYNIYKVLGRDKAKDMKYFLEKYLNLGYNDDEMVYYVKPNKDGRIDIVKHIATKLIGSLKKINSGGHVEKNLLSGKDRLIMCELKQIYDAYTFDIVPKYEFSKYFEFTGFKRDNVLATSFMLRYKFRECLVSIDSWDTLLIHSIYISGLTRILKIKNDFPDQLLKKGKCIMIVTYKGNPELEEIRRNYLSLLKNGQMSVYELDRGNILHYISLFLKKKTNSRSWKTYDVFQCIYSEGEQYSSIINPICVGKELKEDFEMFKRIIGIFERIKRTKRRI